MSAPDTQSNEFEQRSRAVLEESVTRVNARVRSRLNQARQAALEELATPARSFWRWPALVPAAGAAAAALVVAVVLTTQYRGDHLLPGGEGAQAALDDIEMLADNEGLDLIENWDGGGFYEWAAAASEDGDGTTG